MESIPQGGRSWLFSKPLEFLHKVKYGGAVGKITALSVTALLVIAVAMISGWGKEALLFGGIGAVIVILLAAFWMIHRTLEKYPDLALMDGTEIVAYKKIELAAKNRPVLSDSVSISDPTPPLLEALREEEE
jgi:hypothetical protein